MNSRVCDHLNGLELLHDPTHWSVLLPVILTVFFVLKRLVPTRLIPFAAAFRTYLTLEQAEELLEHNAEATSGDLHGGMSAHLPVSRWRATVLALAGFGEALAWLAYGAFLLIDGECDALGATESLLIAATWLYTFIRAVTTGVAVPSDCVALYVTYLIHGVIVLVVQLLGWAPRLSPQELLAFAFHVGVTLFSLALALSMPLVPPRGNESEINPNSSPEDRVTLWEWITFSWVWPMVRLGRKTTLEENDVWNLSITMQSRPIFKKFTSLSGSSLVKQLWLCNSLDLMLDFSLTILAVFFNYTGPYFLQHILAAIESTDGNNTHAYIYAFLAFVCSLTKAQLDMQHLWVGRRAATRTRSELMAAIYDKALKRKDFSGIINKDQSTETPTRNMRPGRKEGDDTPKSGADIGKIVNLMAGDANRISNFMTGIYFLYGPPVELVIASVYLYQLLGTSIFSGLLILIFTWPINTYVTRRSVRIQKGLLTARDKRMSVLNELIGAVKLVKYFAWEAKWVGRTLDAREVEMKWMIKSRVNQVAFFLLWSSVPVLVSIITFATFVARGGELTVSVAFTAIALFGMIRGPLNIIPAWIVQALQARVALDRIATFLAEEEVSLQVSSLKRGPLSHMPADDLGIGIECSSFKWNAVQPVEKGKSVDTKSSPSTSTVAMNTECDSASVQSEDHEAGAFELRDISVMFPDGVLSVVTGPTASGKTALLMALLGEMTMLPGSGRLIMHKDTSKVDQYGHTLSISYAGQTPWLRHDSIKQNILFGTPYDPNRYDAVLECCALKPDLNILEDGDSTEIGARGVSLSGGQKARVALARAVYARTKYVLLDDPLSAVDSHTARFLFDRLLRGPLLSNRTVILVTHHLDLVLPGAHYLVRMLDGRIDTQGPVHELQAEGILDVMKLDGVDVEPQSPVASEPEVALTPIDVHPPPREDGEVKGRKKARKLVKDEHREVGGVKWATYKTYLKASSYYTWAFLAFMIIINQSLNVGEKLWIKIWGEAYGSTTSLHPFSAFTINYEHESTHHLTSHQVLPLLAHGTGFGGIDWPDAAKLPGLYVGIYGAISLATVLSTVISFMVQYTGALKASRSLFKQLLSSVIGATMRWHDVTPQGRILNRFGKDIESIDTTLAGSLQAVNSSMATFIASVLTVSIIFPWFLIPAALLGLVYRELTLGYLNAGRDLRRMESNSRSPIFSDFGEVVEGIVTVRAFSAEKRFLDGLHSKIDLTTKMWYMFWMMNRWLLFNFDVLGSTAILITTLFALSGLVSAGTAGLCITSAMATTQSLYWACRFWTALELDLNSVERVVEYLDVPQEDSAVPESPPAYWPSSNNENLVVIEDLEVKYAPELPSVLHGVSMTLKAGERVGLLGRTGSGKSTLATSILRFVEPVKGRIVIDGIDVSKISLHDLRSRVTFIPQDATLFSGTLRSNIDPFEEHEDSECLDALRRAHVITDSQSGSRRTSRHSSRTPSVHEGADTETVASSSSATEVEESAGLTLDTQISAAGNSLSQGQRQLVSMARALLRRSPIIIMDEATSSIDFATDSKIQATIREEFKDSLLITVAHRLRTVIDYDRLIVLDKGNVAQFDTPYNLIRKEGIFRDMCLKSGTFHELEAAAREKAERDGTR